MPKASTKPDERRQIHIWVRHDLHKRMRLKTAELDTTVQDWVVKVIEQALRKKSES